MKIIFCAVKLAAVALFVTGMAACTTTDINTVADWQGKVWRGQIQRQFFDTSGRDHLSEDVIKKTKYSYEHVKNMRYAQVRFMDGQMMRVPFVLVPDTVEYDDIQKGAIVDFIVEPGPMLDFSTYRLNRVLRLVCRANDDACIDREKSAKRLNTIIDANPGDTFKQYGVTYNRRQTPEEIAKYK